MDYINTISPPSGRDFNTFTIFSWIENNNQMIVVWDPENKLSSDIVAVYKNSIKIEKKSWAGDNVNILDNSEIKIQITNSESVDIYELKNLEINDAQLCEIITTLSITSIAGFTDASGYQRSLDIKNDMVAMKKNQVPDNVKANLKETLLKSWKGFSGTPKEKKKRKRKARKTALQLMFSGTSAQTFKLTASDLGLDLPPRTNPDAEYLVVKADTNITLTEYAKDKPNVYVSTQPCVPSNIKLLVGEIVYTVTFTTIPENDEDRVYVSCNPKLNIRINSTNVGTLSGPNATDASYLSGYLLSDDIITIETRIFTVGSLNITYISGSICFLGDTKVKTDQGPVAFNKLTTNHSISRERIKKVIKMINSDDNMIFIRKHSLGKGIPNKNTYIGRNHGVYLPNGSFVRARNLINNKGIDEHYRKPDLIYNVLLDTYGKMNVNGMTCETININDPYVRRLLNNSN